MAGVPNPDEVALLRVNGVEWDDWTSIMVQHRWMEAYPIFQFSTAEPVPSPTAFSALRFKPGDIATIFLGGIQAIYGPITVRQSASDAKQHGVQLIGKGLSWQLVKSSVRTQTSNFDNMTIVQVAQTIASSFGVGLKVIGTPNMTPFENLQAGPGEPAFDFLDNACRAKAAILGSDPFGNLLLIGSHQDEDDNDWLIEGQNIESISVIINNETLFANYYAVGQSPGNDQQWGQASAQQETSIGGSDPYASALVVPSELNSGIADLQSRVQWEAKFHEGTWLKATIKVPGWKRANGDLWRVGNAYHVSAPTHLLDNITLDAQTVTFEQDNEGGTRTTLELVLPWLLNGQLLQPDLPANPGNVQTTPPGVTIPNPVPVVPTPGE